MRYYSWHHKPGIKRPRTSGYRLKKRIKLVEATNQGSSSKSSELESVQQVASDEETRECLQEIESEPNRISPEIDRSVDNNLDDRVEDSLVEIDDLPVIEPEANTHSDDQIDSFRTASMIFTFLN